MRKSVATLVVGGALLSLAATGCTKTPTSGTVTQTKYEPPYVYQTCASYRKDGTCAFYMPQYNPARYRLRIHGENTDHKIVDKWVDTDANGYRECTTGDYWPGCLSGPQ